jgi:YaiO family outer membrane protein
MDPDYTSRWRLGAGASRALADTLFLDLDAHYLEFNDIQVFQLVPGISWRWHPRSTLHGRLYLARNTLDSGTANNSYTGLAQASWQLGPHALLALTGAWGDENNANPTADLIGNDSYQSYGVSLRFLGRHRWSLIPSYRYEIHRDFDLHALGLNLGWSY